MKYLLLATFLLGGPLRAAAQEETVTWDEVIQSAHEWARENLDTNALRALEDADHEKTQRVLDEIQKQLQGECVLDLALLKDAANSLLPVLESHEETVPYARWLKVRLDYLEFANELRLLVPPPPSEPGQPPLARPNPTPEKEREIWIRKLSVRPWPKEAKPYVSRLKPIFTEEKVPPELVWIAEVESAFDPRARSPVDAAGLFQLMPATARQYGLRTWPFDQRLQAEASARAAAKHLAYLRKRFNDWRLALAAYNAGEGTVQRLLKRQESATYDAIATLLPAETQMYVPKVEATILRREGVNLNELH